MTWIVSSQNVPTQFIAVQLPNAIDEEEERCLGVNCKVREDYNLIKSLGTLTLSFSMFHYVVLVIESFD